MSLYGDSPSAAPVVERKILNPAPQLTARETRIRGDIARCRVLALYYMAQRAVLSGRTEFTISDSSGLVTFQRVDLKYGATRWMNEADEKDRFILPDPRPSRGS